MTKKSVSRQGLDRRSKKLLSTIDDSNRTKISGVAGEKSAEAIPKYLNTPSEHIIENEHNAWIVLGRDRPAERTSGYGGKGDTQVASIDIVVGRMGHQPIAQNKSEETMYVDPNFKKDSARIYISQKTDIDDNFALVGGLVGNPKAKSGIALKADGIRIIGREGIKLVTGGDLRNSQGADIRSKSGIDLIAGNDDEDLQPLVKGKNMVEALKKLTDHVNSLNGIVDSFLHSQMKLNQAMATHFHYTMYFGTPTSVSPPVVSTGIRTLIDQLTKTKRSLLVQKRNLVMFKLTYCEQIGNTFINSRYNNTN